MKEKENKTLKLDIYRCRGSIPLAADDNIKFYAIKFLKASNTYYNYYKKYKN